MGEKAQWVTFTSDSDSDEALSLSDLPVSQPINTKPNQHINAPPTKDDPFEFRILASSAHSSTDLINMCAADDVFSHGQLLPLGPTQPVSRSDSAASTSNTCGSSADAASQPESRADSTARISFDSSASVSRSLSSNSCGSSAGAAASSSLLRKTSNNLHAYSTQPESCISFDSSATVSRSLSSNSCGSSAGAAASSSLLRKTSNNLHAYSTQPESCVSLDSSASVSRSLSWNSAEGAARSVLRIRSKRLYACASPDPRVKSVGRNGGGRRSTGSAPAVGWGLLRIGVAMAPEMEMSDMRVRLARGGSGKKSGERRGSAVWRLVGGGLMGCKCSAEEVSEKVLNGKKKGLVERRERMFEWLEDLSLGKEPLMKFGV